MGQSLSMQRRQRVLMTGLPGAGKSTMVKMLCGKTLHSAARSVEKGTYMGVEIVSWDAGENDQFVIKKWFDSSCVGIIFVVDSTTDIRTDETTDDPDSLERVSQVLDKLLARCDLQKRRFVLLANKQDCDAAHDVNTITESLKLETRHASGQVGAIHCLTSKGRLYSESKQSGVKSEESHAKLDPGLLAGFEWLTESPLLDEGDDGPRPIWYGLACCAMDEPYAMTPTTPIDL